VAFSPDPVRTPRAWYGSELADFLIASPSSVIGRLASANEFSLEATQRDAWRAQIDLLQRQLAGLAGFIAFEFSIPRMGRRIDVVLLIGPVVFVIEFKVGERAFDSAALEQVWDYALDLKNFHEGSHAAPIVPMLVATEAKRVEAELQRDADGVYRPLALGAADLRREIERCLRSISGTPVDAAAWLAAPYHPTPTIIEAARFDARRIETAGAFVMSMMRTPRLTSVEGTLPTIFERAMAVDRRCIMAHSSGISLNG
jgi:hypothetical protein